MEPLDPVTQRIITAKEERRQRLRNLPYHEKVAIMIKMQRMIVPIIKDRDPRARIWELPEFPEERQGE